MSLDSLAHIKTHSPLKISIAFALGIILPSGFLGFLGLRSYQYEGRLMQKETEEQYAAIADVFEKKVVNRFSELQSALRSLVSQPAFQHLDSAQLLPILRRPPSLEHLSPERLFVFDETDAMVAPWREKSSTVQQNFDRKDLDWGTYTNEINRLERLEFAQRDFMAALQGYKSLPLHDFTPVQQAALLKNIAGDYRQLHQTSSAISIYVKLAQQYEQVTDFTGLPMGVLGRQMAIEVYEDNKDWGNALELRLDLLDGLLLQKWKLTPRQRKSLIAQHLEAIKRLGSSHPAIAAVRQSRWEDLQNVHENLENLEREGENFAKNDWPGLLQRMHRRGQMDQGAIFQMGAPSSSRVAVVTPILASESNRRRGLVVAIFSPNTIWSMINDLIAEVARPVNLNIVWEHSESRNNPTRAFWKPRLQRNVPVIDPPLHFEFIDLSSNRDQAFHRRQWIFGGMIGLSFLVIIVGLVFTSQAVKRETEVSNLKADFVANISHELRTPLSVIYHIGEKLSAGRFRSDGERQEIYDLLNQETGNLRYLIEDILDFSKMLAGKKKYRREPLDLIVVTLECVNTFQPKAEARGFWVTPTLPSEVVPILGDPRALRQAILNLLDNALKYSGDSHAIDVQVSKTDHTATLAVTDHGIGIAESDQEKIFEKFHRVESPGSAPAAGGVGLGLAMVKHVIEGHGGKIHLTSKIGHGSTFSLIFPLGIGDPHATHPHH